MVNPISFLALDHLVLRVKNLPLMEGFYTRVLGMQVERRLGDLGLVQLRAGNSLLDLVPVDKPLGRRGGKPPSAEGHNLDHFCWTISPFDPEEIDRYLKSHAVQAEPVERRYGAQGFGPSIYLKDPEGNVVELKGPSEPDSRIS